MQSHHTSKVRLMLLSSAALILAIVAGLGVRHLMQPKSQTPKTPNMTALRSTLHAVGRQITAQFTEYQAQVSPWFAQDLDTAPLEVPSGTFKITEASEPWLYIAPTYPVGDDTSATSPAHTISEIEPHITPAMQRAGFVLASPSSLAGAETAPPLALTRGKDEICKTKNYPGSEQIFMYCDSSAMRTEAAAQLLPFVSGYLAHHPTVTVRGLTAGPVTVKSQAPNGVISASEEAGYDIAEMIVAPSGQDPHIALFYRKDSEPWQYITTAPDEFGFSCSDIEKNHGARKALYDQVCYDSSFQGQRRIDTNRRATQ